MGIDSLMGALMRAAVFLDRDGVITEDALYRETGEWEAPLRVEDVVLRPGAIEGLARLRALGHALIVVSNQGAHAKGKATLAALWGVHLRVVALVGAHGLAFDDCFYSYSHPDGVVPHFSGPSLERKPGPYFLLVAAARHDLDLARSWMIGDRDTDIACGRAAGTRTIFVRNPRARGQRGPGADAAVQDLREAAEIVAAAGG
jgi:D-glycero-D-manno-heptose 1,7-bisphosphate phosphatase